MGTDIKIRLYWKYPKLPIEVSAGNRPLEAIQITMTRESDLCRATQYFWRQIDPTDTLNLLMKVPIPDSTP